MQLTSEFPDPARTDAAIVSSGEWAVGALDRLPVVAAAITAAWQTMTWPAGLLSYAVYVDTDGDLIRDYAQWTDAAAADAFGPVRHDRLGIERRDETTYHRYRGGRSDAGRAPGAVVGVRVDTDSDTLSRAWVDAVFEALDRDRGLPDGGMGAFFHISTDGRRVLNYAEWASAAAHRQAMAANGRGISSGPWWDKVQNMPGVRPQSVTRFHLYATMTP